MNNMYIQCRDIGKTYGAGEIQVSVFSQLLFAVEAQQRIAINGSSGSGKSTLLHLIGGLDLPDKGEIIVADKCVNHLTENQRCLWRGDEVGFIYQFHHLLPEFTALENVAMPLLIQKQKKNFAYEQANELLAEVGLGNRLQHRPHELSGGERQRVSICRALINKPGMILADEPTGNLDTKTAELVMDLILKMSADYGATLIAVTHDHKLSECFDLSYYLDNGQLHLS